MSDHIPTAKESALPSDRVDPLLQQRVDRAILKTMEVNDASLPTDWNRAIQILLSDVDFARAVVRALKARGIE